MYARRANYEKSAGAPLDNYVSCPSGSAMKCELSTFCQFIKGKIFEKIILREFVIK